GKNGPLQGPLNEGDVNVSADGTIATKRAVFGQLRLVRFARPELLQPAGGTLLRSDQPLVESSGEVRVVSGAIEKSNVQTMREMGRLAEITRS
ncbi:flagellar basal body rod C-terminal domain-containing protein, partial [Klebsiella pneumoniae]|nr:flagellar basal body rod C-terminal domain-containing protein [Klebsiella pneumoniae]